MIAFCHATQLMVANQDAYISGAFLRNRAIVEQIRSETPSNVPFHRRQHRPLPAPRRSGEERAPAAHVQRGLRALRHRRRDGAGAGAAPRDLAVFVKAAFLAKNVRGMAIAPPHKPLLVDLLDGCGLFGRVAGSVNVVRRIDNGELEGDLFDGEGLIGALDRYNIPFRGKRVLILGAGVSAAAIGVALAEGGTVNGAEHIAFYDTAAGKAAGVAAKLDSFFDADHGGRRQQRSRRLRPRGQRHAARPVAGRRPARRRGAHGAACGAVRHPAAQPADAAGARRARARPQRAGRLRDADPADAALPRLLRPQGRGARRAPRRELPARADLPGRDGRRDPRTPALPLGQRA